MRFIRKVGQQLQAPRTIHQTELLYCIMTTYKSEGGREERREGEGREEGTKGGPEMVVPRDGRPRRERGG